jgi:hypothetical protein
MLIISERNAHHIEQNAHHNVHRWSGGTFDHHLLIHQTLSVIEWSELCWLQYQSDARNMFSQVIEWMRKPALPPLHMACRLHPNVSHSGRRWPPVYLVELFQNIILLFEASP